MKSPKNTTEQVFVVRVDICAGRGTEVENYVEGVYRTKASANAAAKAHYIKIRQYDVDDEDNYQIDEDFANGVWSDGDGEYMVFIDKVKLKD